MSRLGGRLVVSKRDFTALSREKTIVLALLIQLFVALFSSFLVVGLTTLYSPDSVSAGSVGIAAVGDEREAFAHAAADIEGVDVQLFSDLERATAAFEDDRVQAVVEARSTDGRIAVTATVPANSLRKTLVVVKLRATLEALERAERTDRARYLERSVVPRPPSVSASPYYGFSYTVLVPLLLFLPVFISGSIAVDSITEEIERGTLELLRVSPLSLSAIVDGKALTAAVLAPAQAALWTVLLAFNGISVANVPLLVGYVAALAVVMVAVGVAIALWTADRQRAQLLYSLSVLGLFGLGAVLPEHPVTTAALLAIDSPAPTTLISVAAYALFAVVLAAGVRAFVARADPERL